MVRALQEHVDRSPGPGPKMLGERSRRHQHEVRGIQLLILDRLRVADDPEDVALADGTADRLETSEHDVDVAHPTGQAIGILRRLDPHLRPGPSQAASEALGQVPVAPSRRDSRRRRGDGQHQAERRLRLRRSEQTAPAPLDRRPPGRARQIDRSAKLLSGSHRSMVGDDDARHHDDAATRGPEARGEFDDRNVEIVDDREAADPVVGSSVDDEARALPLRPRGAHRRARVGRRRRHLGRSGHRSRRARSTGPRLGCVRRGAWPSDAAATGAPARVLRRRRRRPQPLRAPRATCRPMARWCPESGRRGPGRSPRPRSGWPALRRRAG